jgi:hypothetical protein
MRWNVEDIAFLYRPDVFTGSFDNAKMQARHEQEVKRKLEKLKTAIDVETDPFEAMKILNSKDHIQFLINNIGAFQDAGRLEEAVLALYGRLNAPFASGGDAAVWINLFEKCDTTSLYNLGDPIVFVPKTVYRGSVSGLKRSLSWTPNRKRAEKFAERWKDPSLGGGEIYEVDIAKNNILIYRKYDHEDEILLDTEFIKSAEIRDFKSGA